MSSIYAMSDIHGCIEVFDAVLSLVDFSGDNKLVLCGDYIHGGDDGYAVLDRIISLERKYGTDKVIVLAGNHEDMVCEGRATIGGYRGYGFDNDEKDDEYISWMQNLRRYYVAGNTIFVHAGVDEEAEDMWEWADEYTFTEKFPAQTGPFYMDIVAGHVGTSEITENPRFHDIYFDGQAHYYIDGSVTKSGEIPVLRLDLDSGIYYSVTEYGEHQVVPYSEDY